MRIKLMELPSCQVVLEFCSLPPRNVQFKSRLRGVSRRVKCFRTVNTSGNPMPHRKVDKVNLATILSQRKTLSSNCDQAGNCSIDLDLILGIVLIPLIFQVKVGDYMNRSWIAPFPRDFIKSESACESFIYAKKGDMAQKFKRVKQVALS